MKLNTYITISDFFLECKCASDAHLCMYFLARHYYRIFSLDLVQHFKVVDNSYFSANRLTVPIDSPYPSFII